MEKYNKEELETLILQENLSYEEIGRRYNVTGAGIKKAAKRLGIELPQRRKINPNETFNKGYSKHEDKFCETCGNPLLKGHQEKFCSRQCRSDFDYISFIKRWKLGNEEGKKGKDGLSGHISRYIKDKYDNKCQICG